ncbi:PREDICTED: caspase recruitment domain-containing protein 8-like isoform X5 [Calidris pugnax]|uniref:caspase recruitment domain-containing protein 8-like isoform X5 n=1 Tax=Calidris pugnax TaxID=198806 RepID=UPI00071D3663|nr:PREDICTED: caspase recruitment domain-containing protein 8-like isoform X5 [Calidris pugnax]
MAGREAEDESTDEFHVFIKTSSGIVFAVPVSLDDTVWDLKVKLNRQDPSLTPDGGRLINAGRQMEDSQTLQHYGIKPNSFVYHILRLRAGGENIKAQFSGFVLTDSHLMLREELDSASLPDKASVSAEMSYESKQSNDSPTPEGNCWRCMWEDLPKVTPVTHWDDLAEHLVYRADLPRAGVFQCSLTGLSFEVKSAVTITYRYDTWAEHLSEADWETWVPAGPLFHIKVQPGVVQAVYLPHFICLAEDVNTSLCSIAHFKSGEMTLERPTRLIAFSAVLENPSFSLLGVLWRRLRSTLNSLPMHSLVLIFQQFNAANTTLHFYLIPDDNSVKQAILKQEMEYESKFIPKPPPFRPLFFGCNYQVTTTAPAQITPQKQLPFYYKSPKEQQLFVEIYIENMAKEIELLMTDTRDGIEVWRASLRSGDANLPARVSGRGAAFMKENKTMLCSRMGQLRTILMYLRDANVINSDEEEEVRHQDTKLERNRMLLELVEKKGWEAQEQLYQILQRQDPYLMEDLEFC